MLILDDKLTIAKLPKILNDRSFELDTEKAFKLPINGTNLEYLERITISAYYASLAYCLGSKDRGEIASEIHFKAIIVPDEIGGNDIFVYFKGKTLDREQWMQRMFTLGKFPKIFEMGSQVDRYLFNEFKSADGTAKVLENIVYLLEHANVNAINSIKFIGHGMGGVWAMFAGLSLRTYFQGYIPFEIFTFGQPPIGDLSFAKFVNYSTERNITAYRVTNGNDFVPRLPLLKPPGIPLFHHAYEIWIDADCVCSEQPDIAYLCRGDILDGFKTEHPVFKIFWQTSMGDEVHFGPYFGHIMGTCPPTKINRPFY
ncbi:hypothetical protein G9A89_020137 [Geosiphon pyriformis]|nr:hypothetical protein G9A89_020137 [Geosiphon pyriformis]